MGGYILRRILYAIPVLIGINFLTFVLFFMVNTPNDVAYMQLGSKHVTPREVETWKTSHGYDLPLFYNTEKHSVTETLFWQKSIRLFMFDFGAADNGRDIKQAIVERYGPSLSIAIPTFLIGLFVNVIVAMFMTFFRGGYLDAWGVVVCVVLMSISTLFYIIAGQYLIAHVLKFA